MQDIISAILERRKRDAAAKGFEMGCAVPLQRTRPVVPFLTERGVILEIKRASPSKGDIAPSLDAAKTAKAYIEAGAKAISVLTEEHWFKGSLNDLIDVSQAVGDKAAVLRKDFIYCADEVDVSYRCGADAVLVIARMLDEGGIKSILERVASLKMSALIELRERDDVFKTKRVLSLLNTQLSIHDIILGVNARDLKDFSIDSLAPSVMLQTIQSELGTVKVITESGVLTPRAASLAGAMGFYGLLLGEAAAKSPEGAGAFVSSFESGKAGKNSAFWQLVALKRSIIMKSTYRPLIKICGLTSMKDAMAAAEGADFLGFVFYKHSKRCCTQKVVLEVRKAIDGFTWNEGKKPLMVGVVADKSISSDAAISLCREGVLDAVQFHSYCAEEVARGDYDDIAHYAAVNAGSKADIERVKSLISSGEMRVLIDAKVAAKKTGRQGVSLAALQGAVHGKAAALLGGTGVRADSTLCAMAAKAAPLWLAGGITADNVSKVIKELHPELIDVASGVECLPGVKSEEKLFALFAKAGSSEVPHSKI